MSVQGMNHFTVLSDDLEATKKFYCDLLGFEVGPRPNFQFPGYWLWVGDQPILHVIHRKQLNEVRAGVIDHMAFTATDLPATVAKLEKAKIKYELRRLPAEGVRGGLWQLFFDDPHGGKGEVDFDKDEAAPKGYAAEYPPRQRGRGGWPAPPLLCDEGPGLFRRSGGRLPLSEARRVSAV